MRSGAVGRSSDVNLWRIPLGFSLASLILFGLTMIPDVLDARGVIHLPEWFTIGGIDDARAILSAMLSCVSTVLALIFSVSLLVLSMVATLFGPRLLYRFLEDWVTQATIGLFMATFIYLCLVFLVTHQDPHSTFIPEVSLITSWFLVIASFAFLIYFSHRIAASIQNPDMIGRIVDDLQPTVIRRTHADLNREVAKTSVWRSSSSRLPKGRPSSASIAVTFRRSTVRLWWLRPCGRAPSFTCFTDRDSLY